jgi:hypothetical protein
MQQLLPGESMPAAQSVPAAEHTATAKTTTTTAIADRPSTTKRPRASPSAPAPDLSVLNDGSREFLRHVEAVGRERDQLKTAVKGLVSVVVRPETVTGCGIILTCSGMPRSSLQEAKLDDLKQDLTDKTKELANVRHNAAAVTAKAQAHMSS